MKLFYPLSIRPNCFMTLSFMLPIIVVDRIKRPALKAILRSNWVNLVS